MFRLLRFTALLLSCSLFFFSGNAQGIKDPTQWTYSARQTGDNDYEICIRVKLEEGWHIWSMRPEGDGMQIPPSIGLKSDPKQKVMGPFVELGQRRLESMEGIEKPVAFFSDSVSYITHVQAAAGSVISGKQEYQVCNDRICLPPTQKEFSIVLPSKK